MLRHVVPLFIAGCAALSHPPVAVVAPSAPIARAHVPGGAVMRLWHIDTPTTFVPADTDRRGLLDALRVEWDERGVRFAARPLASRPQVAWRVGERWHFLGRVAREEATSFLGEATTVASVTSGVLGLGTGRVVAVRDGRAEGAEMPAGWILDAAFGDDLRGLALRVGGEVWRTDDGGARWSPVDLSGDVGLEVYARDGERQVRGAAGCFEVGPVDARSVPCDELVAAPALDASERAFLLDALPRRVIGPADDDGNVWVMPEASDAATPTAVRYAPASDHLDLEHPMELPCARPSTFVSGPFFLRCDERHRTVLYLRDAAGAWRPHLQARRCSAQPRCVASGDGERVACEGACVDDGACDGGSLCERVGTSPARTVRLPEGTLRWRIVGYANGRRVLSDGRTSLARAQLWREGEPPSSLARDVPAVVSIDGPFALGGDGAVHLATRDGAGMPMVMDGRPGEPFVARPLPPWRGRDGRQRQLARCGDDGVFLAKDESATWVSRGPGDDWRTLSGVSGMSLHGPVECASWGWRSAEGTHVGVGWGAPQRSSHSTPSAAERVREPNAARWTCVPDPVPRPPPPRAWPNDNRLREQPRDGTAMSVGRDGAMLWSAVNADGTRRRGVQCDAPEAWFVDDIDDWMVVRSGPARAEVLTWSPGGEPSLLRCGPNVPPRRERLSGIPLDPGVRLSARDGERAAALLVRGWVRGPESTRGALLEIAPDGAACVTPTVLPEGLALGVWVEGSASGVAWETRDHVLHGVTASDVSTMFHRPLRGRACGRGARGAYVLDDVAAYEGGNEAAVTVLGREGDEFCVRELWLDGDRGVMTVNGVRLNLASAGRRTFRCTRAAGP